MQRPVTRLLLVNPRPPESFWTFRWTLENVLVRERATNPPLGLATLAALCPPNWEVTIVDESVQPLPLAPEVDIVGVCGMAVQHARQRELLEHYRAGGYYTVAGGSYASLCGEQFTTLADCVVVGEAERTWPRFCADYDNGAPEAYYKEESDVSLADSPVPRFDLLAMDRYATATLQFSRGCPFRCEFCDIIVMFGRRPRTKSPEQIVRELDALRATGARSAFFIDDNLIGDKRRAKALLRTLVEYQEAHGYPLEFGTEASLDLAGDEELLSLFRRAGFTWLFLGIETPDVETLRSALKGQNTRGDLLTSVRTIHSYGISVYSGFIVGFDADDETIFERQYRFILDAGIQVAMVGLLTALPRTPLHARLAAAGRLRDDVMPGDNTRLATNVIPARMTYDAMVEGYKALYKRLVTDRGIALRILAKTRWLRQPGPGGGASLRRRLGFVARLLRHGILPGGPRRWYWFARTLMRPPRLWHVVVTDWILGLSIQDFVLRTFDEASTSARPSASRA
jgi:radical SAM superfamily enzyme YgiQ (UPF0313 family)